MKYGIRVERAGDDKFIRGIVVSSDSAGVRRVENIAEMVTDSVSDIVEFMLTQYPITHVIVESITGEWIAPDCLSLSEAAEATLV